MRALLFLPMLLMFVSPDQNVAVSDASSPMTVLDSKWSKVRRTVDIPDTTPPPPVQPVTAASRNFERNVRANAQAGTRDPNADTIEGRSAALEKSVQDTHAPKPLDGFAYRVKVQNATKKIVEVVFWEYQFTESSNQTNVSRRQFLCGVNIKPNKGKELQAFSFSGPSDKISVESLANKSGNHFEERVVINRVEYADGTIWQRKDWDFAAVRSALARAIATPWGAEMCRGL